WDRLPASALDRGCCDFREITAVKHARALGDRVHPNARHLDRSIRWVRVQHRFEPQDGRCGNDGLRHLAYAWSSGGMWKAPLPLQGRRSWGGGCRFLESNPLPGWVKVGLRLGTARFFRPKQLTPGPY